MIICLSLLFLFVLLLLLLIHLYLPLPPSAYRHIYSLISLFDACDPILSYYTFLFLVIPLSPDLLISRSLLSAPLLFFYFPRSHFLDSQNFPCTTIPQPFFFILPTRASSTVSLLSPPVSILAHSLLHLFHPPTLRALASSR